MPQAQAGDTVPSLEHSDGLTEGAQARLGLVRRCCRSTEEPDQSQLPLDRRDGGTHDREGPGSGDIVSSGQAEGAEDTAGVGVVDRGGRAAPRRDGTGQVLGCEDLHGLVESQCGARSVGPRVVLGPRRPRHEVDRFSAGPQRPGTFYPHQPAGGVADRDQEPGVDGVLGEQPPDDRHHRGERMAVAPLVERLVDKIHQRQ